MKAAAIIVAAGAGLRAGGGLPKQFAPLLGRPVLQWSVDALRAHPAVSEIVLVTPGDAGDLPVALDLEGVRTTPGGATRTQSVTAGLNALAVSDDTPVLIHDAARPGLSAEVVDALLDALNNADAAAPALPVSDALKRETSAGLETVDRNALHRVQTPQAFKLGRIKTALAAAGEDLVDDLAAIEADGGTAVLIRGHRRLGKITYAEDFHIMADLLNATAPAPRMGTGFDVHEFEPGDHVTLCGVDIPHTQKLKGHSDADAGWHAVTDAILGAAALGDIGDHFPPSDPQWKDAPSDKFLAYAAKIAADAGWAVSSIDITLICEAPKVKPHREAMRRRTAEVLELPLDAVSIKATTTEGLGFAGRREGIAAQAAAVLAPIRKPA
ncbi:MAG: bifunctional 2-C-methyl-D-erythritol 4-phosphate cytidylyltransferase/2-C-methyl-D-erythritol 2,4-cyclodiphosphate synthase [Pseudomonadota bacterium]